MLYDERQGGGLGESFDEWLTSAINRTTGGIVNDLPAELQPVVTNAVTVTTAQVAPVVQAGATAVTSALAPKPVATTTTPPPAPPATSLTSPVTVFDKAVGVTSDPTMRMILIGLAVGLAGFLAYRFMRK